MLSLRNCSFFFAPRSASQMHTMVSPSNDRYSVVWMQFASIQFRVTLVGVGPSTVHRALKKAANTSFNCLSTAFKFSRYRVTTFTLWENYRATDEKNTFHGVLCFDQTKCTFLCIHFLQLCSCTVSFAIQFEILRTVATDILHASSSL